MASEEESQATTNGEESQATTNGVESQAIIKGEDSKATTRGEESKAITNGVESQATTNGEEFKGTTNERESKTNSSEEEPKTSSNKELKASSNEEESMADTNEEESKAGSDEAARQEFPLLHEMISREVFLVYSKNCKRKHIIKTAEKVPLYTAKFQSTSKCFSLKKTDPKLIVWNADGEEILHMCQTVKDLFYGVRSEQNMKVIAMPDTYLGYINKNDDYVYEVYDASGTLILNVQKKNKSDFNEKRHKITTPDHMRIGTIGNNRGSKFRLKVPDDMPIPHKALLFALTVSLQDYRDEGHDMPY